MKEMQPLLEKISKKFKGEVEAIKILIDSYYLKQFMSIADKWPDKESKRLKYSKLGIKIIRKRNKMKIILNDLINAIDYIPKTHKELRKSLKNNKNPIYGLKELINFAYRIDETYKEFSKIKD
jgi:glutaredoxin-related protein